MSSLHLWEASPELYFISTYWLQLPRDEATTWRALEEAAKVCGFEHHCVWRVSLCSGAGMYLKCERRNLSKRGWTQPAPPDDSLLHSSGHLQAEPATCSRPVVKQLAPLGKQWYIVWCIVSRFGGVLVREFTLNRTLFEFVKRCFCCEIVDS